jgi:DNA polymerase III alpha subunit (gram-positive type)
MKALVSRLRTVRISEEPIVVSCNASVVIFDIETTARIGHGYPLEAYNIAAHDVNTSRKVDLWIDPIRGDGELGKAKLARIREEVEANKQKTYDLKSVLQRFIDFAEDPENTNTQMRQVILMSHNATAFDVPILKVLCTSVQLQLPTCWRVIDSLSLFRKLFPKKSYGMESYGLRDLYHCFMNKYPDVSHYGIADVETLYKLYTGVLHPRMILMYSEYVFT